MPNSKPITTVILASSNLTTTHDEPKTTGKRTQLKQPKKVGLFPAKKLTVPTAPQSEVNRIIAGMKRNA